VGFLEKVLWVGGAAVVGAAVRGSRKAAREHQRRVGSPLSFDDGITEQEFARIAETAARGLPRLESVHVDGMTCAVRVRSNSGLSTWTARVDFNDYGHLTGTYWLKTENADSIIPEHLAKVIQAEIRGRLASSRSDA